MSDGGSLVMSLQETQEESGLLIVPAPSPEEKRELYQLPKTFSVLEKVIGKRNGRKTPSSSVT